MAAQEVDAKDLERHLKSRQRMVMRAMARAARQAAQLGRTYLVKLTSTKGKVYLGQFKASWKVVKHRATIKTAKRAARVGDSVELVNQAPHAGIIELGARPHKVNQEGIENLTLWAKRKLGLSDEEAQEAAHAIAWKLRRYGQRPTYMVRDSLPTLRVFLKGETDREIRKQAKRPSKKDLRFN